MAKRCALVNASLSDGNPIDEMTLTGPNAFLCQSVADEGLQCHAKSNTRTWVQAIRPWLKYCRNMNYLGASALTPFVPIRRRCWHSGNIDIS